MNRKPQETRIKYIDPSEVSEQEYVLCTNHDQFEISTHFTRVPKKDDPNCDRVYYFIKRQALYARLEGGEG